MEMFMSLFALMALAATLVWIFCVSAYFLWPSLLVELIERFSMFRAGFTNKKISVGDLQFSFMERGNPETTKLSIVLVHGFHSSKAIWCQMSHALPSSLHLIALDLPGHGKSTRKYHDDYSVPAQVAKLHQFVNAVGLNKTRFHITGISMGGHIAGVYAAKYPTAIASVIMMCPAGINTPHLSEFVIDVVVKGEKNYLIPETAEDFQMMINKATHRGITVPYFIAKLYADVRKPTNDFFKKVLEDIVHPNHRFLLHDVLEYIEVPALVLWGEDDKIIHVSSVDIMKEKIKNCQVHILDKCGHAIFLERPWKTAKLMLQFLSSMSD